MFEILSYLKKKYKNHVSIKAYILGDGFLELLWFPGD